MEKREYKQNSVERNYKLDNIKAFLIFLVVFGHLLECFGGSVRWWLYLMIYCFHMPAFVYATGCFARENPQRLVENLIYPYCIYQVLYLLFQRYFLGQENSIQFTTPYWLLWYLMADIFWMFFMQIIECRRYSMPVLIGTAVGLSLLAGFDQSVGYYLSLSRMIVLLPFFIMGHFRVFDAEKILGGGYSHRLKTVCFLIILISGTVLWKQRDTVRSGWFYHSMSYEAEQFSAWIRFLILSVACIWILFLSIIMPKRKIKIVSNVGQYTLPVFLLHGFLVRWIGKVQFFQWSEYGNILAAGLLAVCICVGLGNRWIVKLFGVTFSMKWVWGRDRSN